MDILSRQGGKTEAALEQIRSAGGGMIPCYSRKHSFRIWQLLKRKFVGAKIERTATYKDWDCRPPEIWYYVQIRLGPESKLL